MSKIQSTNRIFAKVLNLTLLVMFTALSAGGYGLHYAPFLGLHHSHSHTHGHQHSSDASIALTASASACDCGHDHSEGQNVQPFGQPVGDSQLAQSNAGDSTACGGHCEFCKYFSEVHLTSLSDVSPVAGTEADEVFSLAKSVAEFGKLYPVRPRGPPIA